MINLLRLATPVVGVVHPNMMVKCKRYVSSSINAMGVMVPVYEEFEAAGQVQPNAVQKTGNQANIDVAKKTINIWINAELHTVDQHDVADIVVYDGHEWNIVSCTNWNPGNGWGTYTATRDTRIDSPSNPAPTPTPSDGGHADERESEGGLRW